jgi:hypothetical protein
MKPQIAAQPLLVSDATALAVVGMNSRQFRAFVREHNLPRVRAGRRTLVRVDALLAAFDRLSGSPVLAPAASWDESAVIAAAAGRGRK